MTRFVLLKYLRLSMVKCSIRHTVVYIRKAALESTALIIDNSYIDTQSCVKQTRIKKQSLDFKTAFYNGYSFVYFLKERN